MPKEITNKERYKTPKGRTRAFMNYCLGRKECNGYRNNCPRVLCVFEWLEKKGCAK